MYSVPCHVETLRVCNEPLNTTDHSHLSYLTCTPITTHNLLAKSLRSRSVYLTCTLDMLCVHHTYLVNAFGHASSFSERKGHILPRVNKQTAAFFSWRLPPSPPLPFPVCLCVRPCFMCFFFVGRGCCAGVFVCLCVVYVYEGVYMRVCLTCLFLCVMCLGRGVCICCSMCLCVQERFLSL